MPLTLEVLYEPESGRYFAAWPIGRYGPTSQPARCCQAGHRSPKGAARCAADTYVDEKWPHDYRREVEADVC